MQAFLTRSPSHHRLPANMMSPLPTPVTSSSISLPLPAVSTRQVPARRHPADSNTCLGPHLDAYPHPVFLPLRPNTEHSPSFACFLPGTFPSLMTPSAHVTPWPPLTMPHKPPIPGHHSLQPRQPTSRKQSPCLACACLAQGHLIREAAWLCPDGLTSTSHPSPHCS